MIFLIIVGVSLCLFISLRVIVKEIFVDRMGVWHSCFEYILYDLNTTIEISEGRVFYRIVWQIMWKSISIN